MSISANIAEGYGRSSKKEKAQFYAIALGSCNEVCAFLDIITAVYSIDTQKEKECFNQVGKQLYALRKHTLQNF